MVIHDMKAYIYYGPSSWFKKETAELDAESLLDLVYERDNLDRQFSIVDRRASNPSETEPEDVEEGPEHVLVESGDYASLTEAAISNFAGLVRSFGPKNIYLNNPPELVRSHLGRVAEVKEVPYELAGFDVQVLRDFNADFQDHLVGQGPVKSELLAAMYQLTRQSVDGPVVVMFYGPSGVGKTETAKFISRLTGGVLFRKQFSMLHSEKFASYVFGGSHQEPSLALDLLERESSVILFDEFDKANSIFHSAFYELFDEGVLEDKNYRVEVGRSLIICTSNYGSEGAVKRALGEALYSRFDAFIEFHPLSGVEVETIIDRLIDAKFEELTPKEVSLLSADELKLRLKTHSKQLGNIRKLSSMIDQIVGHKLALVLLETMESMDP
ncbi:hypothetical protein VH13_05910 [Corynebacterium ulcerans]|uniref:AAA family ATPase n=1 Tax=Corynebacterium ulcerans TaxID=65058 RepID=UPI00062846FD|nr:AAA family ATPase [Corynebacterium ulcerans]KKO85338.1 hypothetical protein VH13_05910 [Corynebacterium ulcerans]KKO87573.1 hypothetical protein VH15_02195 [Corynebacterium ulcerans]BDV25813.1 ATPase [Corynebacterium ulcerans]